MPHPPVAITGYGCVSAIGNSAGEMLESLRAGKSGIGPLQFERDLDRLHVKIGAQALNFDPTEHFEADQLNVLDRFAQLALVAAREAVALSGLDEADVASSRTAVVLGTGIGGANTMDDAFFNFYGERRRRFNPMTVPRLMTNAAASQVSMALGARGVAFTTCSACASSNHAVAMGLALIRGGLADRVITGGSEACITPAVVRAWEVLRVLSPTHCSPFSKGRVGMVLGEGAGIVVLERLDAAKARGATIYGKLAGAGMNSDADDLLRPNAASAAEVVRLALADAGIAPEAVTYINAHGTGTITNDITETEAVRKVFGSHADVLAMSSTKSMHGHALGGVGAIELVATLLAVQHGFLPPTVNWKEPDPLCDIDCVPNASRPAEIEVALSNSFAFGGLNSVLCVTNPDYG